MASPLKVGAATCKVGNDVWRDDEGHVRVCTVASRVTLFGVDVAADAYTWFHADGRPYQTHIARAQELTTARGQTLGCAPELVVLSAEGALEHCELAARTKIGSVVCKAGEDVGFHPNGELALASIDAPMKVSEATFPVGTTLFWHPSGKLAGGWLREETRFRGHRIKSDFVLYESGELRAFELAEPEEIGGQKFPRYAKIELWKNGKLRRAEYEVDSGFMPHGEPWSDTRHARFDCDGKPAGDHTEHYQAPFPPPRFRAK